MNLNIGIVGAGGFAHFAAKAFSKANGIKIVAVTDVNPVASAELSSQYQAATYYDYEDFLRDKNIELVYIATPPSLHYHQSKKALLSGKHVISEKPASLLVKQAEELDCLAKQNSLLYTVNLMQRYNPLYSIVKQITDEKIMGDFLHGFFENYASDEKLDYDHWFWQEEKSGGIFIEHGVHFFDMFSGWLGEGKILNAVQISRPGMDKIINDRVQASVLYQHGTVNFYHGFDQPGILDRQEMRLLFTRGEISLYGWVPVQVKLHGLFTSSQMKRINELLNKYQLTGQKELPESLANVKGRFRKIEFDHHVTMEYTDPESKQERYQQMIMAMISDQLNWIKNQDHQRVIDSSNAIASLRMAEDATRLMQKI